MGREEEGGREGRRKKKEEVEEKKEKCKKNKKRQEKKRKESSLALQFLLLTNQKLVPKPLKLVSHLVVLSDGVVVDFAVSDHKPKVILK